MVDTATSAGHGAGGLPQFDLAQWPGQMVWVLIVFGILFVLFAKVFVPRVGGTITAREDRISGDIAEARRLKAEAEADAVAAAGEMAAVRARAQKLAVEAKNEAKRIATARQAAEDAKLGEAMAAAETRIAAARGEAMGHVRAIAVTTAQAMIERLTGRGATVGEVEMGLAGDPGTED
jgi:F-type H+-transporting ATPase subunit b